MQPFTSLLPLTLAGFLSAMLAQHVAVVVQRFLCSMHTQPARTVLVETPTLMLSNCQDAALRIHLERPHASLLCGRVPC